MWSSNSSWNVLRRRKKKRKEVEKKPLDVLRVDVRAGRTRTGPAMPCSRLRMSVGALNPKVSLELR